MVLKGSEHFNKSKTTKKSEPNPKIICTQLPNNPIICLQCVRLKRWYYAGCGGQNVRSICNFGIGDLQEELYNFKVI